MTAARVSLDACRCEKCGSDKIVVRWHAKGGRYDEGGCGFYAKVIAYGEHLHRTCQTCLFEWIEPVKAAPEADPECETCGHPRSAHNLTIETCRCEKSIYTDAPLGGGSVYPCQCSGFKGPV